MPNPEPLMVTGVPTGPAFGRIPDTIAAGTTVKTTALLTSPPFVVTITFPLDADVDTIATILLLLHLTTVAAAPLKETAPFPLLAPNPEPRSEEHTSELQS